MKTLVLVLSAFGFWVSFRAEVMGEDRSLTDAPLDVGAAVKLKGNAFFDRLEMFGYHQQTCQEAEKDRAAGLLLPLVGIVWQPVLGLADVKPLSFEDVIRLLDHAVSEAKALRKKAGSLSLSDTTLLRWIELAFTSASDDQTDEVLRRSVDARFLEDYNGDRFHSLLFLRLIDREIAAIRGEKLTPVKLAPAKVKLPDGRAGVPVDLQDAWLLFMSVAERKPESKMREGGIDIDRNGGKLRQLFSRLVREGGKGLADELAQYHHMFGCIVDGNLMEVHRQARVLAYLRERRLKEAIGAAFSGSETGDQRESSLKLRLVALAGDDGPRLIAGSLLARFAPWREGMAVWQSMGRSDVDVALESLASGAERDVWFVLHLAEIAQSEAKKASSDHMPDERIHYPSALGIIAARDGLRAGGNLPAIDEILRLGAKTALLEFLAEEKVPDLILATMPVVVSMRMAESVPVLRRLLTHWSEKVPIEAAAALRGMGEAAETPQAQGPARFQLVSGGKPLAHQKVAVDLGNFRESDGYHKSLSGIETDGSGVLSIQREELTNPRMNGREITFSIAPDFFSSREKGAATALFGVAIQNPESFGKPVQVDTQTHPVTLKFNLPRSPKFYAGKKMVLSMSPVDREWARRFSRTSDARWAVPVEATVVLPNVQAREWSLSILVPGAAPWKIERLQVGADMGPVAVKLEPATDVAFKLVGPNGEPPVGTSVDILRGGKRCGALQIYEGGSPVYLGFKPGSYVLHIAGTAEFRAQFGQARNEHLPSMPEIKGRDLPFVVPKEMPARIDLGRIVVRQDGPAARPPK